MTPEQQAVKDQFTALQTLIASVNQNMATLDSAITTLLTPVPPPPPPPPPPLNPSGQPMPSTDLPGWKLSWSEDFNITAAEGEFIAKYPNIAVHYYGTAPKDTSHRGMYDTQNISASNGVQRTRIYTDAAGVHHVSVWSPKLSGVGKWGDVAGGRFAIRWRSDSIPTYKQAWLLWPLSTLWPKDGEIDFPERALNEQAVHGFMHRQNATVGSDQDSAKATGNFTQWHTTVIEWVMGKSCAFYLDDVLLKKITARVPSTPMHWNIQTETTLDKSIAIDPKATGNVEIDWLAYWAPI